MTTLDLVVLLFGVLISGLVGAGFVLMVYGRAFSGQLLRDSSAINTEVPTSAKFSRDELSQRTT